MKSMIVLGLVMPLLQVLVLCGTDTSPLSVPEGKPVLAEPQQILKAAHIRKVALACSW